MKLEERKNHTHIRIKHAQSTKSKKPLHHKHNNKHGHENIHSQKIIIKSSCAGTNGQGCRLRSTATAHQQGSAGPGRTSQPARAPFPTFKKQTPKPQAETTGNTPPCCAGPNPSRPTQLLTHIRLQLADVTLSSDYPRGGVSQPHIIIINHSRDDHRLVPA